MSILSKLFPAIFEDKQDQDVKQQEVMDKYYRQCLAQYTNQLEVIFDHSNGSLSSESEEVRALAFSQFSEIISYIKNYMKLSGTAEKNFANKFKLSYNTEDDILSIDLPEGCDMPVDRRETPEGFRLYTWSEVEVADTTDKLPEGTCLLSSMLLTWHKEIEECHKIVDDNAWEKRYVEILRDIEETVVDYKDYARPDYARPEK